MSKNDTRAEFSNFSNKVAMSIEHILQHLIELTAGWPKVISGQLCYLDKAGKLRPITSATALLAWIDGFARVTWHRGAVTKEEFFEGLLQRAERFAWATEAPHFPRLPDVYYTGKFPKAKSTGALGQLVDHFHPATKHDRALILALVLTLFWGGPPGKRPIFTITTRLGRDQKKGVGVGKTSLAELLSRLVGGSIAIRPNTSPDRLLSGLLSPSSLHLRAALVDNLKTYRFSNDLIESLVTCEEINGHRLHHGHATRPNYLTTIVTVNGASFSKDMAERSVVIYLDRPTPSGTWIPEMAAHIDENRRQIIADVRWYLERPPRLLTETDRWQLWASEVLSRLDDPDALIKTIRSRRVEIDEDDQDAGETIEYFRAWLRSTVPASDPKILWVRIPSILAIDVLRRLKPQMTDRQAAQYLKQLGDPRLCYYRKGSSRGYLWVGEEAKRDLPPILLSHTVPANRK